MLAFGLSLAAAAQTRDNVLRVVAQSDLNNLQPSSNTPFIMPKRVAETQAKQQIADPTGSGPFIFRKEEWRPGAKVVYVKNPRYRPRPEPPSAFAGGKEAKVERVEWVAIPDPLTA